MKVDELLVFDIWGDFAHFRRGYTTTSALSYPFPPKSTLIGIIAAILGLPNKKNEEDNYCKVLSSENIKLSLRIINPIKKIIIKENFIDTKHGLTHWEIQRKNQPPRTQIPLEFIKNPYYRVYVWIGNMYSKRLKELIENKQTFYTPYFGISECLANLKFVKQFTKEKIKTIKKTKDFCEIDSIIPLNAVKEDFIIEENIPYGSVKIPIFIDEERIVEGYQEFIFNIDGNSIKNRKPLKTKNISSEYKDYSISIGGENVILF